MTDPTAPVLLVEGVEAGYGQSHVLHGVDLEVRRGEAVALVGPNGAGKTTLLNVLSGIRPARQGRIHLNGDDITGRKPAEVVRRGLIHVPEGRQVFPHLSVEENLWLGGYARGDDKGATLRSILELFPRLAERRGQAADTLSGGEQQMLAIGRGLMARPEMLLVDEPTMGLAPVLVDALVDHLAHVRRELGTTMLIVEQNAYLATEVCDRFYVMTNGRIVADLREGALDEADLMALFLGNPADTTTKEELR